MHHERSTRNDVTFAIANAPSALPRTIALEREVATLRRERDDVRARVEKILQQIDVLTKGDAGG